MWTRWALGGALAIVSAAPAQQVGGAGETKWFRIARDGAREVRFAMRSLAPEAAQGSALVFAMAETPDERSVERAIEDLAASLPRDAACTLVGATVPLESFAAIVEHCSRTFDTAERAHLVGRGDGARDALCLGLERPASVASVIALAPSALGPEWLQRAGALACKPVAFVRGQKDDREPMLAVLEPLIEAGSETAWLDFASTRERVTLRECEGVVAARWKQFAALERERTEVEARVRGVLTDFHLAASRADLDGYVGRLAPDGVFLGTDARERWNANQFREFCAPYFARGQGWTYVATERHVEVSRDRRSAWFDERLANDKYGEVRGSGALRLDGERWRIVQYVMSFPVPNELSGELVERVKSRGR
jgi:pimeloyl-ACP methyl ester carboxylesterase